MRKAFLSGLAVLALTSGANATKLYVDDEGRVWTKPKDNRKELKGQTPWFSKADKLKFSVLTYLGYRYSDFDKLADGSDVQNRGEFEIRRAYFQVKAYLLDDPKSYYRVTFDISKDVVGDEKVRAKYAYLYLNEVLPSTGLEIGLAHRPWHDYEEHNAWYYRSISKVLVETRRAGDLSNSADFGIMAKTRTKYFDSDIGIFNGEGYHAYQIDDGMSLEWRLTGHLLGVNGKDKQTKKTYFDVSFFGQLNQKHIVYSDGTKKDMNFYGIHSVYNMPSFLIAAEYLNSQVDDLNSTTVSSKAGKGWSVNTEFRMGSKKEYRILARYDFWEPKKAIVDTQNKEKKSYILGLAWHQNRNVEWIANVTKKDYNDAAQPSSTANTSAKPGTYAGTDYMLTAKVIF